MRLQRLVFWSGAVLVLCGVVSALRIPYFYLHNRVVSERLLASVSSLADTGNNVATGNTSGGASVVDVAHTLGDSHNIVLSPASVDVSTVIPLATPTAGTVSAVLDIPKLALKAPVLEGTDDKVLNVAVGHLSGSATPGQPGTDVLSAHNATWFRHIDNLQAGDEIDVRAASGTYIYVVTGHQVVHTEDTVSNTAKPVLILEACYPLDALYLTPERYLVYAQLDHAVQNTSSDTSTGNSASGNRSGNGSKNSSVSSSVGAGTSLGPQFTATVPADLQSEGLLLHENNLPLGTLTYTGMDASFTQSEAPLALTNAMVQLVEAFLHASVNENTKDLSALFPSLAKTGLTIDDRLFGVAANQIQFTSALSLHVFGQGQTVQRTTALVRVKVGNSEVTLDLTATGAERRGLTVLTLDKVGWE